MLRIICVIICLATAVGAVAEQTAAKSIERVQISASSNGTTASYYFVNTSGWGATTCPNAMYVQITESYAGSKAMLSMALTAKSTNAEVTFLGECYDDNYFKANYMILE